MLNYRRYVKAIPKPQKNGKYSGYRGIVYYFKVYGNI